MIVPDLNLSLILCMLSFVEQLPRQRSEAGRQVASPTPPSSSSFSSTLGEHDLLQGAGMSSHSRTLALFLTSLLLFLDLPAALDEDGVLLLHFKYYNVADPLGALGGWNYDDATPCAWNGVECMGFPDANASRVIGLVLPNSKLAGRVPWELGLIRHLRHLELSGNALNGTLPASIFNSSELRVLSLADNEISGDIPELPAGCLNQLQVLNLSDNALVGKVPGGLALLPNLTAIAIANNYLSGELPAGGFGGRVEYVDLSANLISGSLPPDLGGQSLRYLNLSRNQISGVIPPQLASGIPANSTVDFAFNNLTGEIPQNGSLVTQAPEAFAGNSELCGKPLENLCTIPSTPSGPPKNSTMGTPPDSPPAFAAMPRNAADGTPTASDGQGKLRPAVIIAIAVGDVAGIGFLGAVFYYFYRIKKKNGEHHHQRQQQGKGVMTLGMNKQQPQPSSSESRGFSCVFCSSRRKSDDDDEEEEDSEYESTSSDTGNRAEEGGGGGARTPQQPDATLIAVDGETELEMETLLKASAYILGASASSIVYKAVLADGTALAVRRIGDSSTIDKLKDFEAQVRSVAKFRHPNLLRLRGFYWSADEKLLIHDYVPNGSLANISFASKKQSSSPFHLSWESRLRITRGVARGLAYLHEKKSVHGNVKPSNILLDADMEPKIADFGLDRLLSGDVGAGGGYRLGTSARLFGSKRSLHSQGSLPELSPPVSGASPLGSSAAASEAPLYQAPEFLKSLKPSAKSDVYSFGMVLLEMLAGRVVSEIEVEEWNAGGLVAEERHRVVRMADPAVRGEVEGKEEALMSCFRLGFACCAAAPQRRPAMKEVVQVLEKLPPPSSPPFA
ncbi:LOW QUALITY PROTEIN: putative LRR receptor-like serine/threonine-protein kinase At4g37250 [Curcuma longa]|uniref:LOW QUALITY PROTEIN: putative LRR receptor-like serine/threonine-protein kinase At4g37250 n=1 Tax=Curcuma longa TaxID=136217 RepID=UPI003D9F67F7